MHYDSLAETLYILGNAGIWCSYLPSHILLSTSY